MFYLTILRRDSMNKSDIKIAHEIELKNIYDISDKLNIKRDHVELYGNYKAKISLDALKDGEKKKSNLILVSALTPTAAGEGKTTVTIGLGQSLKKIGKNVSIALREPSLGPCMGLKGGAAGGGYSQVLPMEDINLHFTGDMHAVSMAHNLLAAVVDNHLHQRSEPEIHPRKVDWKRVIDMNDRTLRSILVGLAGAGTNGVMREDAFEITAASEIMAVL